MQGVRVGRQVWYVEGIRYKGKYLRDLVYRYEDDGGLLVKVGVRDVGGKYWCCVDYFGGGNVESIELECLEIKESGEWVRVEDKLRGYESRVWDYILDVSVEMALGFEEVGICYYDLHTKEYKKWDPMMVEGYICSVTEYKDYGSALRGVSYNNWGIAKLKDMRALGVGVWELLNKVGLQGDWWIVGDEVKISSEVVCVEKILGVNILKRKEKKYSLHSFKLQVLKGYLEIKAEIQCRESM